MSRTDLFDRLLERDGAFSEREAAGLTLNLLRAVRRQKDDSQTANHYDWNARYGGN